MSKALITESLLTNISSKIDSTSKTPAEMVTALQSAIASANATTGESDTTISDAVQSLNSGYGGTTPSGTIQITENGTVDVTNYASAEVNVSGGSSGGDSGTGWTRPSDWPNLDAMDISGGNVVYLTYDNHSAINGFCVLHAVSTGGYTVDIGVVANGSFTVLETHSVSSNTQYSRIFDDLAHDYIVVRVTGTAITSFSLVYNTNLNGRSVGSGYRRTDAQAILEIRGSLPNATSVQFRGQFHMKRCELNLPAVQSCSNMFDSCYSLESVSIGGLDTPHVISMNSMFSGCNALTELDVSEWDTSNVTTMAYMFQNCTALGSLTVDNWVVSSVTNMTSMFSGCNALTELDVSEWNVSSVTNMGNMFTHCHALTELNVSEWNVSGVTNMNNMFSNCYALTELDVSEWNVSSVTNMGNMFYLCYSLTSLDVGNWAVSGVTNMGSMFNGCYALTELDVSEWNVSSVTNMTSMFTSCLALKALDVSGWDFSGITVANNVQNMFRQMASIMEITIPASLGYIGTQMFAGSGQLQEWHFLGTTPPALANTNAFSMDSWKTIYVPYSADHSVLEAYQTATNWSTYASYIQEEPQ